MYSVSSNFKTAMESNIKSVSAYVSYYNNNDAEVIMTGNDAITDLKISADGELGSSSMRKLEVTFLKSRIPDTFSTSVVVGEDVWFGYSTIVSQNPDTWESVFVGTFNISEVKNVEDEDICSIVAYDRMIKTMSDYTDFMPADNFWVAGATLLRDYIEEVLYRCGVILGNSDFVFNDLVVDQERFANMYGFTVRDLVNNICEISGTVAIISPYLNTETDTWEDRLYFKKIDTTTSVYTIPFYNLITYKFYKRYGNINKVIFAREPQEDYVERPYSDSISTYGLTEWKVNNNQLIDYQPILDPDQIFEDQIAPEDNRETYIDTTKLAVCGADETGHAGAIYYYPFEAETCGYGWFEIGDRIKIENTTIQAETKYTVVLSYSVNFDGGINEKISARQVNKTDTKVKYTSNKNQNQTQLVVDKQNQVIRGFVAKFKEQDDTISSFEQTDTDFYLKLTQTGGNNILENSVMYSYSIVNSLYVPTIWELSGTGTINISFIGRLGTSKSLSGNQFTLSGGNETTGKTVSQKVKLSIDKESTPTEKKSYYSLSFKLKKSIGTAWARIRNNIQTVYTDTITSDAIDEYTQFVITGFLPKEEINYVELFGGANSESSFTDVYLELNSVNSDWCQARGEVSNETVNINKAGIIVKGTNQYSTIITPTEFTGKYNNDTVFTLNNDVTEVTKLKIKGSTGTTSSFAELNMPPLKLVAVSDGWTIIKS